MNIEEFDRLQRRLLVEAESKEPEKFPEEMERIKRETRALWFSILNLPFPQSHATHGISSEPHSPAHS